MTEIPDVTLPSPSLQPLLLTVAETERAMGWSHTRTCAAIAAREIKSIKCGRRRMIPVSALHDYIAARLAEAA